MTHNISRFEKIRFSGWPRESRRVLIAISFIAGAARCLHCPGFTVHPRRVPAGATINPTATAPVTWTGTATGGGALNAPLGLIDPRGSVPGRTHLRHVHFDRRWNAGGLVRQTHPHKNRVAASGHRLRSLHPQRFELRSAGRQFRTRRNVANRTAYLGRHDDRSLGTRHRRLHDSRCLLCSHCCSINTAAAPRSRINLRHSLRRHRLLKRRRVITIIRRRPRWAIRQASPRSA